MAMLVPVCAGLLRRFSWLNQRIIDDQPALPTPWTWVQFQSRFEVLGFAMRSSSRDSGHVILLEPVQPFCFLILSYFSLRSQLGSSPSPATRSHHRLPGNACDLRTLIDCGGDGLRWLGQSRHKCVDVLRAPTGEHTGGGQISIAEPQIGLLSVFSCRERKRNVVRILSCCSHLLE